MSDHHIDKAALIKVQRTALSAPVESSWHRIQKKLCYQGQQRFTTQVVSICLQLQKLFVTTAVLPDFGEKDTVTG